MTTGVDTVRLLLGVATAAAPDLRRTPGGGRPTGAEAVVLRVLGARHVVQAVVVDRTGWRSLSAGVDLLHGTSMLVLAAAAPRRYGRAALLQAATAAALIVLELRADR